MTFYLVQSVIQQTLRHSREVTKILAPSELNSSGRDIENQHMSDSNKN